MLRSEIQIFILPLECHWGINVPAQIMMSTGHYVLNRRINFEGRMARRLQDEAQDGSDPILGKC